jgi:predicted flavoprotein YhiN
LLNMTHNYGKEFYIQQGENLRCPSAHSHYSHGTLIEWVGQYSIQVHNNNYMLNAAKQRIL